MICKRKARIKYSGIPHPSPALNQKKKISSVQSLTNSLDHQGNITDKSAEILFQSFLQEALVSSSGMGRDNHSSMLSIQHFLCQPWCHPPTNNNKMNKYNLR